MKRGGITRTPAGAELPHPAIKRWAQMGHRCVFLGDRNDLCDCHPRMHSQRWVVYAWTWLSPNLPPICPHWRIPNWGDASGFQLNTDDEAEAIAAFEEWERWVKE